MHFLIYRYTKAYYRRASALFALGKYKSSLKDFKHVCKLEPQDRLVHGSELIYSPSLVLIYLFFDYPQARDRLRECDKAAKVQCFAEAIESEETAPFGEAVCIEGRPHSFINLPPGLDPLRLVRTVGLTSALPLCLGQLWKRLGSRWSHLTMVPASRVRSRSTSCMPWSSDFASRR
jgi:tetratricopeptide (TPR) repeat protein